MAEKADVHRGALRFLIRRIVTALVLVFVVSSAAFLLARLAPGDHLSGFDIDPRYAAAERHRLGFDRPLAEQYAGWLRGGLRLDFGESTRFQRPVAALLRERALNTALLGLCALALATVVGIPMGVMTGSSDRGAPARVARGLSLVLLSVPPLVTSLVLLLIAARTGWLPVGGSGAAPYLILPTLALALPLVAVLERLQSRALRDALSDPCILAAAARGVPRRRLIWRHAMRLSLKPVLGIYGVIVGGVLSGSFVVEIVMSWPGLGALMYEALVARDLYLVAGCAAAGGAFLAAGILAADVALVAVDPRIEDAA